MTNEVTLDMFLKKEGTTEFPTIQTEETAPNLPEGWRFVKLGDVCKIVGGGTPKRSNSAFWNGDIVWLAPKELDSDSVREVYDSERKITAEGLKNSSAQLLPPGTVIYSSRATIGKVAIAGVPLTTNQGFANFICREGVYNRYIAYCLKWITPEIQRLAGQTTFPEIKKSDLKLFKIPLPPLEEQRRIVARIEEIMSRIEQAKELREEALKDTEAIMQSALHQTFSKAEEKGWEIKKLKEVCKVRPSKTEVKDITDDLEVTFVPMKAVSEITGRIENPSTRLLREVRKGYTYFREGDVLFAKITPCMENGKSAIARNLVNGLGFGSTEFHVIRASEAIIPEWVYYFVRQKSFRELAARNMTGTAGQQRVPKEFLEDVTLPLPPLEEQKRLVVYLKRIQDMLQTLREHQERTKNEIEAITQAVLRKAFSGKL